VSSPRDAATVILLRPTERAGGQGYQVFLLRRRKNASFMSGTFVFPGGGADPGEHDPRFTAARELFEEAGVLLSRFAPAPRPLAAMRARLNAGESFAEVLGDLSIILSDMHYFSARFYVALLPSGQTPSFDAKETVDEIWVTPDEALARAGELRLPPPQVRTFLELAPFATVDEVLAECTARAQHPHPIMPRMAQLPGGGFTLLLPWDPEYASAGTGDAAPMPADHPLAVGPSRFILEGGTWKNVVAPSSPTTA
jgi:8-oxo-dGTP pyrophosphatase MutT (NUDIX family)